MRKKRTRFIRKRLKDYNNIKLNKKKLKRWDREIKREWPR